jgi:hypothetical protein
MSRINYTKIWQTTCSIGWVKSNRTLRKLDLANSMHFAFSLAFKSNRKLTDLQKKRSGKKEHARSEQTRLHRAGPAQIGFAAHGRCAKTPAPPGLLVRACKRRTGKEELQLQD